MNGSTAVCAVRKPTFTVGPKSPPFMQNSKLLVPVRPRHETPFLFLSDPYGNLVNNPSSPTSPNPSFVTDPQVGASEHE